MLVPSQLHHVGYLVQDIETAARDFSERLGYVVESDLVEDPVQTAFVKFLRQPNATSWLELVMPNKAESKLSNALKRGVHLHHLCYETGDIDGACSHLQESGVLMICRPVAAVAFPGRKIAWFMDRAGLLMELVEAGEGPLALRSIHREKHP